MKLIVAFRNFVNAPNNCTFCPHSAFCVFRTIHAINTRLSVQQRSHVSCAVRTEYLVMRPGGGKILSRPYPDPHHQQVLFLNSIETCVIDRVAIYSSFISLIDKLKRLAERLECHQLGSIPARA